MFGTMPRNSPLGPSASTERGVMHRKRRLLLLLRCMHTPARARAHRHTRTQTHRHTDTRTSLLMRACALGYGLSSYRNYRLRCFSNICVVRTTLVTRDTPHTPNPKP